MSLVGCPQVETSGIGTLLPRTPEGTDFTPELEGAGLCEYRLSPAVTQS